MDREFWTSEEKRKLKAMTISPVKSSPERLKALIEYFRTPGASLWDVTEGRGPIHVSKSLGTKIRDYVGVGDLDWVMGETPVRPTENFDEEWRRWLLSHAAEFSEAGSAYQGELKNQIQSSEIHLGWRATFMPPRVAYGPKHRPFIESIFRRDSELVETRREFESALNRGEITEARELSEMIGQQLSSRIAI